MQLLFYYSSYKIKTSLFGTNTGTFFEKVLCPVFYGWRRREGKGKGTILPRIYAIDMLKKESCQAALSADKCLSITQIYANHSGLLRKYLFVRRVNNLFPMLWMAVGRGGGWNIAWPGRRAKYKYRAFEGKLPLDDKTNWLSNSFCSVEPFSF